MQWFFDLVILKPNFYKITSAFLTAMDNPFIRNQSIDACIWYIFLFLFIKKIPFKQKWE